jgi:hypothetical protein
MPTDACDLRIVGVNGNNGIELLRLSPTSVEELNGVDYDKESSHRSSPSSFEFQDIDYNQLSFDWQDIFNYLKRDKSEMAQTLGEALCATRELLVTGDLPVDFKLKSLKTCGEPLCLLRLHAMMTALPLIVQRQKAVLS